MNSLMAFDLFNAEIDTLKMNEFLSVSQNLQGFEDIILEIDDNNILRNITFPDDEYFGTFIDCDEFAIEFSKILKNGEVKLYFDGEDENFAWGYKITPGKVFELYKVWTEGVQIH